MDSAAAAMLAVMEEQIKGREMNVIAKFKAIDDGDGVLTLQEFKTLIRSVRVWWQRAVVCGRP